MEQCTLSLRIPNSLYELHPGDKIRLSRFDSIVWTVQYGWFSFDGNRSICCWYLVSDQLDVVTKPLNLTDLDDIYMITV